MKLVQQSLKQTGAFICETSEKDMKVYPLFSDALIPETVGICKLLGDEVARYLNVVAVLSSAERADLLDSMNRGLNVGCMNSLRTGFKSEGGAGMLNPNIAFYK